MSANQNGIRMGRYIFALLSCPFAILLYDFTCWQPGPRIYQVDKDVSDGLKPPTRRMVKWACSYGKLALGNRSVPNNPIHKNSGCFRCDPTSLYVLLF